MRSLLYCCSKKMLFTSDTTVFQGWPKCLLICNNTHTTTDATLGHTHHLSASWFSRWRFLLPSVTNEWLHSKVFLSDCYKLGLETLPCADLAWQQLQPYMLCKCYSLCLCTVQIERLLWISLKTSKCYIRALQGYGGTKIEVYGLHLQCSDPHFWMHSEEMSCRLSGCKY